MQVLEFKYMYLIKIKQFNGSRSRFVIPFATGDTPLCELFAMDVVPKKYFASEFQILLNKKIGS